MSQRKPTSPPEDDSRDPQIPSLASLRTGVGRSGAVPWRTPTRRAFFAMLSAAAAAAIANRYLGRGPSPDDDRPANRWTGKTRWIGHC